MFLEFLTDDTTVPVQVNPDGQDWRLEIDGQVVPLQAVRSRDGSWLVETHQGRRRLFVASRGDERLVFCDGKVHTLRLRDPEHEDEDIAAAGGPHLVADMPGKVVAVPVETGQIVKVGHTVLIIESMKMETELAAPVAGTVATIHVSPGQVVGMGDPLLDITPDVEE
nr:biotin/lipoyl-containing protein [Candidatus Krumholzibacteria bacterium]